MEELGVDMSETKDVSIGSLCLAAARLKMQWNDYSVLWLMGPL
jgi:precorrin-6B methylase 1